ncbi:MAG: tRNA (guanosine(46)-N7)-methyltransferase TrmB [Bacteroidetes bacterium]|nr:tRNA (guanosine(46)-N7)-methyltransferase TrmB [Bacteroidota bacterium]
MGRPKLEKFADLKNMPQVMDEDPGMKGRWKKDFFKNDGEMVLELACGKGDYTLGLAQLFPEKNFVGMDLKGNRIWSAAKVGEQLGLTNIGFVRAQIDHIDDYFDENEIDEIWITFADPYLKPSKWKKRLTSSKFLKLYKPILKSGGLIHLKTDNEVLYEFTLEVIKEQGLELIHNYDDIYAAGVTNLTHNIQTYYEKMHLKNGLTIKYVCFRLGV